MNFWGGFFKQAAGIKRLGDSVRILTGKGAQGGLRKLVMRQTLPHRLLSASAKAEGISLGKARDRMTDELKKRIGAGAIGGTVARGKKGTRVYLDPHGLKKFEDFPSLRGTLHHELFHAKVPVLGHSEFLAHFYGGLRNKKGKLSPGKGLQQVGMFMGQRPARALIEAGAGVAAGKAGLATHRLATRSRDEA